MKYIITDQNEVAVGINTYHQIIKDELKLKGRVIAAGHCEFVKETGKYRVYGESVGSSFFLLVSFQNNMLALIKKTDGFSKLMELEPKDKRIFILKRGMPYASKQQYMKEEEIGNMTMGRFQDYDVYEFMGQMVDFFGIPMPVFNQTNRY